MLLRLLALVPDLLSCFVVAVVIGIAGAAIDVVVAVGIVTFPVGAAALVCNSQCWGGIHLRG